MAYPTYKGRLELLVNRPKEVRDGWRSTVKSPTEFGEQLVCTALYWLSKDVVETSENAGQYIDLFKQDYYGKEAASQKQSAYCAVFAWFLMNEAAKNMGCTHKFPGNAETYGRANDTLTKSAKIYRTEIDRLDTPPTVGSIMYRYSTESSSSGHFGIVVDVDSKNQTFDTVEGNVHIDEAGTKEGVGAWRYRFDDVKTGNGIAFIHVEEEAACKNAKAKSYNGFDCRPVIQQTQTPEIAEVLPPCIKKIDGKYIYFNQSNQAIGQANKINNKFWFEFAGKGWVEITDCKTDYGTAVVNNTPPPTATPEKNYSPEKDTALPPAEKVKKCKDVIVSVPAKNKLQHYTVLKDPKVIADITDANIGSEAARFGSALWYNRPDINPGSHTGFGMFRDNVGNLIYVLDADQPQSQQIMKNGFLGFSIDNPPTGLNILEVNRRANYYNGGGWKEQFVNDLASKDWKFGNRDNVKDLTEGGALVMMPPNSNLNNVANWRTVPGQNLISYLREIENKGKPLDKPIIIYITERGTPTSGISQIKQALSVVSAVSGLIGIPIPPKIMGGAEALITVFEQPNLNGIVNTLPYMMDMAEYFAPQTVKGAKQYFNDGVETVGKYIKDAGGTISEFVTNGYFAGGEILKNAEKSLGLSSLEISKIFNRYSLNNPNLNLPDLTKVLNGISMKEVNKKVQNMSNMFMVDKVRRVIESGSLEQSIKDTAYPLYEVPILQDLFIAGGSNAAMRLFPKIETFTNTILKSDQIKGLAEGNPEIIAAIIGNNFGHIPTDKGILKTLEIEALIGKARLSDPNIPFLLPESIEDEYKECYKFIIEQSSDTKVLHCPEGWEWDTSLRKCVNKTVSSGYTPNTSNSSNLSPIDGNKIVNDPVKVTSGGSSNTNTDIGYIPNDWTYYGDSSNGITPVKTPVIVTPPIKTNLPTEPVRKDILPPCITAENGEYYYYPDKSKKPTQIIYESNPATTVYGLPEGGNTQIVRTELKPTDYISLPGGLVSLPANNSYVSPVNPTTGAATSFVVGGTSTLPTVIQGGIPTSGLRPDPLPLPLGLSDEVLPDKIRVYRVNTGTPEEAWYVRIDGVIYDFDPIGCKIIGWNPNKKEEIKVPDKIVTPPTESSEADKMIKKLAEQQRELEAQLALVKANNKKETVQPDERVIALEKQLEQTKLQNQQSESMLVEELKKISNAKPETSPEVIAQLNRYQEQIAELTRLANERNQPVAENPNDATLKEISLLRQELTAEKNRTNTIQTAAPQVQKAVEECTDCDIAKLPSRVVNITEYGNHTRRSKCSECNDCEDCDCDECN